MAPKGSLLNSQALAYFGAENWKTNHSAPNDKQHSLTSFLCPLYKTINKTRAEIEV
jgi:hypothetical protein